MSEDICSCHCHSDSCCFETTVNSKSCLDPIPVTCEVSYNCEPTEAEMFLSPKLIFEGVCDPTAFSCT